ncbi:hypothetical protein EXS45_01935 [Candidatus Nomurabacteria bacterium]|nr:hypothetical protein [Candidatus Nomurabacteria bacterium]
MITPELLGYIRGEFDKGRTREEIHTTLVAEGGWIEADISEAFRTMISTQGSVISNTTTPNTTPITNIKDETKLSKKVLENLIFVIVAITCLLSWYFYRPQIVSFWNRGIESSQALSVNSWNWVERSSVNSWNSLINNFKKLSFPSFKLPSFSMPSLDFKKMFGGNKQNNVAVAPPDDVIVAKVTKAIVSVKNCGTTNSPDLKNKSTYENNAVLNCLGESALRCIDAEAVLEDALFPGVFRVIKNKDTTCNFKLSYEQDSTLSDINGQKLAGQYISCPINIVKAVDNTNPSSPKFLFIESNKANYSKYASQIYFYGTLGLFMENSVDKNKIQTLGCSGSYIDSVVASYLKMQSTKK